MNKVNENSLNAEQRYKRRMKEYRYPDTFQSDYKAPFQLRLTVQCYQSVLFLCLDLFPYLPAIYNC